MKRSTWEYFVIYAFFSDKEKDFVADFEHGRIIGLTNILNTLGSAGWECFSQSPVFITEREQKYKVEKNNIELVCDVQSFHFKKKIDQCF